MFHFVTFRLTEAQIRAIMLLEDAIGMENNADPDQTAV